MYNQNSYAGVYDRPYTQILDPSNKEKFDNIMQIHEINRHVYITAATRSGKSELVKILFARLASNGNIVIFDPHGDFSQQIARLIGNKKAIVYIDPSLKKGITPTINPFRLNKINERTVSIMTQEIVSALESIIDTDFSPNMEALLVPCISTLLYKEDSGIDELLTFMDDDNNGYLKDLGLESPIKVHRDFFDSQFSHKKLEVTKNALATKLQTLLNHPIFSNFITGDSTVNLEKLLKSKQKIIIFRLPKDAMRTTLEPAAKLIIALIQGIVFKRANIPEEIRPRTYLILDEFQNLTSRTLQEMLAESAKNNLSIMCIHQYLDQIDRKTRSAILSNCYIKIVGRNSQKDLKILADEIEIDVSLLKNLKQGEFYIKVGTKPAVKIRTTDKLLGYKEAISEIRWIYNLKYQKKHYYKKIVDTTIVDSSCNCISDISTATLPIPKFNDKE